MDRSLTFMSENPFAVLAVNGELGPLTALVPLVIDENGTGLLGHVAKANPFWEWAHKSGRAAALFQSADAYVSPSYYVSKRKNWKAVPTWNYIALEVRGAIEVETDRVKMSPYLEALTHKMESHREDPWEISDAPQDYIAKLSQNIVGFRMGIDQITHVRKLSQNKSAEDRAGVINAFEQEQKSGAQILASEMRKQD